MMENILLKLAQEKERLPHIDKGQKMSIVGRGKMSFRTLAWLTKNGERTPMFRNGYPFRRCKLATPNTILLIKLKAVLRECSRFLQSSVKVNRIQS
jgi:hypothetical protein